MEIVSKEDLQYLDYFSICDKTGGRENELTYLSRLCFDVFEESSFDS